MRKWLIPAILAVLILANAYPALAAPKKEKKQARVSPEQAEVCKKRVQERLGMLTDEQRQAIRRRLANNPEAREKFMRQLGTMMPAEWNDLRAKLSKHVAESKRKPSDRVRRERSDRPAMRDGRGMNRGMPGMQGRRPWGMAPGVSGDKFKGHPGMGMQGRHKQMMGKFKGMRSSKMNRMHGKWDKRFKKRKRDGTNRYQCARRFTYGMREMD